MTPSTPHAGGWLVLRSRYAFRMYDTKLDGALEKVDAPEPFRQMTREPIERMANFLVNA